MFKLKLNKARADFFRKMRGASLEIELGEHEWLEVISIIPDAIARSEGPDDNSPFLGHFENKWIIRSSDGCIHIKHGYIFEALIERGIWVGWDMDATAGVRLTHPPAEI